jgi:hypothetical protein
MEKKYEIKQVGEINPAAEIPDFLKQKKIPLKFCFVGDGAAYWDKLRGAGESGDFQLGDREFESLTNLLSEVPELKTPTNIIHFGIGNGIEIPAIADSFDFSKHAYIGADISKELIKRAINYQKETLEKMKEVMFFTADVEKPGNVAEICAEARKRYNPQNLLIFSGEGTLLSNFYVFRYIADGLKGNDMVLFSLEGYDISKMQEMLDTYNSESARDFFMAGVNQAGIKQGKFLDAVFNSETQNVEVYFKTPDGKEYLCLTSYKPSSTGDFKGVLEANNLNPVFVRYSEENQMYRALCKRK